jgi:immunity protein, SdpI family
MRFTWRTEWPLWVLLAGMFLLAAITWSGAPDRIPTHWGMNGEVNGYAGKFEGLLVLPLMALGIYLLLLVMPRFDPGRANYAHFAGVYLLFRFGVLVFLGLVYGIIHLWIRGYRPPVSVLVPIFLGALFLLLGSVMGKIRPNWFIGIRTPWTLSSKLSWSRTHRVAGWVFMLEGVCLIMAGVLRSNVALIATLAVGGAGMVGTIVYSYLLWRDDPDRIPPAGTLPAE